MTTLFASGYALATQPVASGAIRTDTQGLEAGETCFDSQGFELPAYWARPRGQGPFPVILVVQEVFGVHEHIKDVCRRLAKEGFLAIAPELYARQGDVSAISDIQEIIARVVRHVPDAQVMADLDATVAYLRSTGLGDLERLAITGFCWGGRISWLYSAHQPLLKAGVAWYGRLVAGPYSSGITPQQPVDVARNVHGAMLGLYGEKDESIPLSTVEQMRAALAAGGKDKYCEIVVYPDAGHAFFADYRPSYHEPSARDGWAKMLAWFQTYGLLA